jgi:hypothetical protein
MSDIDFDELDRAVNGALGGTATPTPVSNTSAPVESREEAPTIERVERTSLSSAAPAPASSTTPTSSPVPTPVANTAPAARRSSGRFMDMVHPSSDMRSRTNEASSPVEPRSVATPAPQPVVEEPQYVESPAWNEPLESPFLPDAKVEKRPLGGGEALPTDKSTVTDSFDFQGLLDEPDEPLLEAPEPQERLEATTMPDPIDFATASTTPEEAQPVVGEPQPEPFKMEEAPVQTEVAPQPVQPVVEAPQPITEEPTGPTSITPQYKEQPSSNQESGPMYDTESYHQAVAQPVKKKSGWFTVIWIILLVLLGAGAGWAVYTYVLPML